MFIENSIANVCNVRYVNVMNVRYVNEQLAMRVDGVDELLPHVVDLESIAYRFNVEFGLDVLPDEGGIIAVRGARQYGKSTWLEQQLLATVREFGAGTAFYLNGDFISNADGLDRAIEELVSLFAKSAPVRRLFIDEITAVQDWQKSLKRLADAGVLRNVLVVTTGSKAADLRHGVERLPGRKGKLTRTNYLFAPIAYPEFRRVCGHVLGEDTLDAYLMSGGSPVACSHLAQGRLPEYAIELVKDWVCGVFAASGRQRGSLLAVMDCIRRYAGTPVGQAKLAREAGLANNTVAAGYVDLLSDLMCVASSYAWDAGRGIKLRRKPCKYHFCNTLVALAWHPAMPRTVADFRLLNESTRAAWYEWAIAQEQWRRAAIRGDEIPDEQAFWQSKEHELDFVISPEHFVEVKLGQTNPLEFGWFNRTFAKGRLTVVSQSRYETDRIHGISLEDYLGDQNSWVN